MIEIVLYGFESGVMNPNERHCAFIVRVGTDKKTGATVRERLPMVFFASDGAEAARAARAFWDMETKKAAGKVERGRALAKPRKTEIAA